MIRSILTVAAALAVATTASATTTLEVTPGVPNGITNGSNTLRVEGIYYNQKVGQSFTATDTDLLSFGFQLQTLNAGDANTPVTFTLLAGSGTTGAVVATRTATIPVLTGAYSTGWYDFDLTGTTLDVGQTYTALLSTTSYRLGLIYGPNINIYNSQQFGGDAYAGGQFVSAIGVNSVCSTRGNCDANFRMTSESAAAVPEPATWAMMVGGFGLVGGAMRRRQRTSVRFA